MKTPTLPLRNLAERHIGLTPEIAECYAQAARVCLDRHHESPSEFDLNVDLVNRVVIVEWDAVSDRERRAWANQDDATRDGAYAVALAATEFSKGLVAIHRAQTKTGADYYVAPLGTSGEDLENSYRLEVSGTDLDDKAVRYRLTQKIEQTLKGNCNLPAIAAVVGFSARQIYVASVD